MTSAIHAREAAGFTVREAARRVRCHPRYLRRLELHGGAPYVLALRLAWLYKCSAQELL